MRNIILSQHSTLDGFVAGTNGEMDWIKLDDELFELVHTFTGKADTALYGRITYEMIVVIGLALLKNQMRPNMILNIPAGAIDR